MNLNEELQLDDDIDELHRTVQDLFEEEEALLNLHMNIIQENAELLTEEADDCCNRSRPTTVTSTSTPHALRIFLSANRNLWLS